MRACAWLLLLLAITPWARAPEAGPQPQGSRTDPAPARRPERGDAASVDSTSYTLVLHDGTPYVELELGGARGLFLVDTGANTSGVDRAWLERTGARWKPGGSSTVGGTTGDLRVDKAVFERFDLGTAFFVDAVLSVQRFEHFSRPEPDRPQIGLLGTDFLNRYQLDLDLARGRMSLRLRQERPAQPADEEAVACAYPLGIPTVGVRLVDPAAPAEAKAEARALSLPCRLDTGASYLDPSVRLDVNRRAVDALRARGARLRRTGEVRVVGISGPERLDVLTGEGPDGLVLEVGPVAIDHVALVVHERGTLDVGHPVALASTSVLGRLQRLVLDPFDHLLWVATPAARLAPRPGSQ
jgi:hypothetical protein